MSEVIRNNVQSHRFELEADGHIAEIVYRLAPGRISFVHTGVPEELSGRGIASKLARHVLDYARSESLRVEIRCSFLASYLTRHPEYLDLID